LFDSIVPLGNFGTDVGFFEGTGERSRVPKQLLDRRIREVAESRSAYFSEEWMDIWVYTLAAMEETNPKTGKRYDSERFDEIFQNNPGVRRSLLRFLERAELAQYPIVVPTMDGFESSKTTSDIAITLQFPLIDTSQAEWEQILEFRKDPQGAKQLRDLRLYFYENFVGKEPAYVREKLLQMVGEYEGKT